MGKRGGKLVVPGVADGSRSIWLPEDGIQTVRENSHDRRTRFAMTMRIFTGEIQFMVVMRVLDRPHSQPAARQLSDKLDDQRRLTVVFPADDMDSTHAGFAVVARRNGNRLQPAGESMSRPDQSARSPVFVSCLQSSRGRKQNVVFLMDVQVEILFQFLEPLQQQPPRGASVPWGSIIVCQFA